MRTFTKSLQISSYLLRYSPSHRSISSSSTFFSSSDSLLSQKIIPDSSTSSDESSQTSTEFKEENPQIPISDHHQNSTLISQSNATNKLLSLKYETSAMEYLQWAEVQPGFNVKVDSLELIFNLMGLKDQQLAVEKLVSRKNFPNAKTAIQGLIDCSKRFDFALDSRVLNFLLSGYINASRIEDAISCFVWMLENNIDLLVKIINDLLNELFSKGMIKEARELYDKLCCRGNVEKPEIIAVATTLMKGYCVSGDLDSAIGLFDDQLGVSPDGVTYSILIGGCCSKGNMEKACEFYDQMIEKGIEPSAYNVSSLISGFVRAQLWEKAYEQLNKAVESGLVDVYSFNTLMSRLCKDGNVDEAQQLWGKMIKCGIRPDQGSYKSLILGYCRKGNVNMAQRMYVEMMAKGFKPNAVTSTLLIDSHFKKEEVEKALNLFAEMVRQKIDCTDYTYHTILSGLCKCGQTSRARSILEDFMKDDKFVPSRMTYNIIIDGFGKEGHLDSAMSVYNEMGQKGVSPSVSTFTNLIDACCKSNNINLALKLKNEMKSKGFKLKIATYGTLIHGLCKRRDMVSACKLFNELCEAGLSPNKVIYNTMISGYRHLNNMEAALSFHQKMTEQGISCDLETYTTLIDGLLKEGKLLSAFEIYAEVLAKEITPDEITFTVLVNGLCKKGKLEKVHSFFKEMEEKGLTQNSLIYIALIAGYFRKGNLPEAFRLYDEMLEKGLTPDKTTFDFLMSANFKPSFKSTKTSSA